MPHPRGHDLQRPRLANDIQVEVQHALALDQSLPRSRLQDLEFDLIVCGPEVLDVARAAP